MRKNILFSYLAIMFLLFTNIKVFASEKTSIPNDAVEFEGHYYKLYDLNVSWEEAQEYFKSIQGHLATITSQEENDFIYNYIISIGYKSAYFGASDKETEGIWLWITGEEFIYSNWHNGEPNNENTN